MAVEAKAKTVHNEETKMDEYDVEIIGSDSNTKAVIYCKGIVEAQTLAESLNFVFKTHAGIYLD